MIEYEVRLFQHAGRLCLLAIEIDHDAGGEQSVLADCSFGLWRGKAARQAAGMMAKGLGLSGYEVGRPV
jgi:hypothetical protein